jgi:hypothetical protein
MFLGLLDLDPDPLVRGTDPDLTSKIVRKTLIPTVFDFFMTSYLRKMR